MSGRVTAMKWNSSECDWLSCKATAIHSPSGRDDLRKWYERVSGSWDDEMVKCGERTEMGMSCQDWTGLAVAMEMAKNRMYRTKQGMRKAACVPHACHLSPPVAEAGRLLWIRGSWGYIRSPRQGSGPWEDWDQTNKKEVLGGWVSQRSIREE